MSDKKISNDTLKLMSNCLRFMSLDAVEKAKSGHPGMPMGMSDVATVLFSKFIKIFPKDPDGQIETGLFYLQDMDLCCYIQLIIF